MILRESGSKIILTLLERYNDTDNVSFIGEYLRLYTAHGTMLPAWFNLDFIKRLIGIILEPEFNVSSDALQTV